MGDAAGTSEGDDAGEHRAELWGKAFIGTSVREMGQPRPLVAGTQIELALEWREWHGVARWAIGCNTSGAPVTITEHRLEVREDELGSTAVGCPSEEHDRQDDWLNAFFAADPTWHYEGSDLTLVLDQTVIRLSETAAKD